MSETDKEVKVTAEVSGLDEKDLAVELTDGVLTISGEKKSETEDKDRLFSERYYGRFERRIPVDDVEPDKVADRHPAEDREGAAERQTHRDQREVNLDRCGLGAHLRAVTRPSRRHGGLGRDWRMRDASRTARTNPR